MSNGCVTFSDLGQLTFEELADVFETAFADYDTVFSRAQLRGMLSRRGFCGQMSFGAFVDGKPVAFTFNGTGMWNGVPTAYDTGTGTVPQWRGKGLAGRIFRYAVPRLMEGGIRQYLLEVLQHNDSAVRIYDREGFVVTREFNCFGATDHDVMVESRQVFPEVVLRPIDAVDLDAVQTFCDFRPSWQNSLDSIVRAAETFVMTGAFMGDECVGYSVFDPVAGDVTQLAVAPGRRGGGIGSLLLSDMASHNRAGALKVVNVERGCVDMNGFLAARGFSLKCRQFEMLKTF